MNINRPKLCNVKPLNNFLISLAYENNEIRMLDMFSMVMTDTFYKPLQDINLFNKVVLQNRRTIEWPGDIDICPDTLYMKSVLIEQQLTA